MEPDPASAKLEAAYRRLGEAIPPELRAELEAAIVEYFGKYVPERIRYQKTLLRRLGVPTDLDRHEEFWLQFQAAARYIGISEDEFWGMDSDQLCAVLEFKAREIERQSGASRGPEKAEGGEGPTIQDAAPSPESDQFATRDKREAAIKRAREEFGTVAEMATFFRVDYRDLRKWARDPGSLAKGPSLKAKRIEDGLLPYCPE